MAKTSGLGDNLYISGFDASGDISALSNVGGGPAVLDFTAINKSAMERQGGVRDGRLELTAFFNHVAAGTGTHEKLSALPTSDVILTYCRGTSLGDPAACLVAKQINYDGNRNNDGAFTFGVSAQANSYGLQWGQQLTAGLRTDTAATLGTSIDTAASASFGAQAFLHVTAFTGTDVTIKIQDSADNSTFADVASFTFTQVTAAPASERIALGSTATVRRYIRVSTVTTGGFTSCTFNVVVVKNEAAVTF
ncbi:Bbp16 family capsid cement protein [Streptomyces sp. 1222.5]|uniref:Bbp16 family capsid cement protein n=1 Tax=Streptomyces sp. 1222.5 TaxID=1881026 RepID=UPI003D7391B8